MPIAYPYKFSDWYGYDQDCVVYYQQIYGSVGGQQFDVCGLAYTPYYFVQTGTETSPAIGTRCFSNISGTVLTQNWHRRDQTSRMNIDSNGDVNAIVNTACTP